MKGASIIDNLSNIKSAYSYVYEVAIHFEKVKNFTEAEKYYLMCEKNRDAINMYLDVKRWNDALKLSNRIMSEDESAEIFLQKANQFEECGEYQEASKIYLLISYPDRAISMYKNAQRYKEMIELVQEYHPEMVQESYLFLAKLVDNQGNSTLAEQYYLAAKDWKSAVQMHCLNANFESAFKIAKYHGGIIPASHVAYLWTKSLSTESAVKTLKKLGMVDDVLEIAVESRSFDFAFGICGPQKIQEVHSKHAAYLEDEGLFDQAEVAYISAGKPREAILMHMHNESWELALSVAERCDPEHVSEVLYTEARSCFKNQNYSQMEMLLLRSPRPDLAISFYKEAGLFKEALLFAEKHVTSKVSEIRSEMDQTSSSINSSSIKDTINKARKYEEERNYEKSIDMYTSINPTKLEEYEVSASNWLRATELAEKFLPNAFSQKTSLLVAQKLQKIRKDELSGDLYARMNLLKEAMDTYIAGALWEKAKALTVRDGSLREYFDSSYVKYLSEKGDTKSLLRADPSQGLEALFRQGEYERCLQSASESVI